MLVSQQERLRNIMLRHGLSAVDVADTLHLSEETVYFWLNDSEPAADTIDILEERVTELDGTPILRSS